MTEFIEPGGETTDPAEPHDLIRKESFRKPEVGILTTGGVTVSGVVTDHPVEAGSENTYVYE